MSPSVLRVSGPAFERNGVITTPRALVSTCEICGEPAPFGDNSSGKFLTWCSLHVSEDLRKFRASKGDE